MLKRTLMLVLLALFVSGSAWAIPQMKPHHKENGLSCKDCHLIKPREAVPMEQCLTCHDLPEAKDDYSGPPDQHDSPHYGPELECENCHHEHMESENFCSSCHEFDFKVP